MATGYRIGGADLDELYEMPHVDHLTRTNFNYREETNLITSNRYLKNGQPIKTAMQKTIFKAYGYGGTTEAGFRVSGVCDVLSTKRNTPFGYLLATVGVGEHELTESNGKVYLDGSELPYAPEAATLFFVLAAGGGGGAGSALLYCSAGGGAGGCVQWGSGNYGGTYYGERKYPFKFSVGAGGAGGAGGENGQAGGDTTLTTYRTNRSGELIEHVYTVKGGGGGNTDDGAGGAGGSINIYGWDTVSGKQTNFWVNGGAGGTKENGGENSTAVSNDGIVTSAKLPRYMSGDALLKAHQGGASSGSNYGGGGGASGLADGAVANSNTSGVAGTLGAGGSGAGYTAFQRSAGGKGGDGVVYIYY